MESSTAAWLRSVWRQIVARWDGWSTVARMRVVLVTLVGASLILRDWLLLATGMVLLAFVELTGVTTSRRNPAAG
jgi:hypothetical protein